MAARLSFENRIWLYAFLAGLPGSVLAILLLWLGRYSATTVWTLTFFVCLFWAVFSFTARDKLQFSLQTLSNILAALREGDYSLRGRGARLGDAMGEVMLEVNALGDILKGQRLGALEATALLRTVMAEIVDVAVFAFDLDHKLRLMNHAGEKLLAQPAEKILGHTAKDLQIAECLAGDPARTLVLSLPGGSGRWGMRRGIFREEGRTHYLVVLTDLNRALRDEERLAWQRLVRVLGHELNNSLAPIKSLAGSLESLLQRDPLPGDWKEDMQRGLQVISGRSESLSRFMEAYTRVAKLPPPRFQSVHVAHWVRRIVELETRLPVEVLPGPEITIQADGDQLDQLLINLVKNAVDAVLEKLADHQSRKKSDEPGSTAPKVKDPLGVRIHWLIKARLLLVHVEDDGPGLSNTSNLFVPFFTTKRGGSGIGLVLCRQIAEAHGGNLTLENRPNASGCLARLILPI